MVRAVAWSASFVRWPRQATRCMPFCRKKGSLASVLRASGIVVHVHPGLPVIGRNLLRTVAGCLHFAAAVPLSMLFLSRLILRLRIDVVHTNSVVIPSPSLAALITRRPHVWHVRELLAEFGSLWRPYQRWVCGLSTAVVAISHCVRDQFEPHLWARLDCLRRAG